MKKVLSILVMSMIVLMLCSVKVSAFSQQEFLDTLYSKISPYGATNADKVKIERYLNENPITETEANQVLAKTNEATEVMRVAGASSYSQLTPELKKQVRTKATEAAKVVDVELKFSGKTVTAIKDGKEIEKIAYNPPATPSNNGNGNPTAPATNAGAGATTSPRKLAYTGNDYNVLLIISTIAVTALVSTIVIKKKIVRA